MRKSLGNNLAWKCLKHWNPAVSVDDGKTATSVKKRSSLLMTGSEYREEYNSTWQIVLKIWKWNLSNNYDCIPARHFRARVFPRHGFLVQPEGSGVQTCLLHTIKVSCLVWLFSKLTVDTCMSFWPWMTHQWPLLCSHPTQLTMIRWATAL